MANTCDMAAAYANAKRHQAHHEQLVAAASARLKAVPGIGSGALGLTPDAVKRRPDYQQAKADYDRQFAALRRFNAAFNTMFAAEIRAERRAVQS